MQKRQQARLTGYEPLHRSMGSLSEAVSSRAWSDGHHQQTCQKLDRSDIVIAEGVGLSGENLHNSQDAVEMRNRRGDYRLCSQFAATETIDIRINIGGVAPPAHAGSGAETRDAALDIEFDAQIGSQGSSMRVTDQLSLPRERQSCAVGASDGGRPLDDPSHRRLKLRQRVRQDAADACRGRSRGHSSRTFDSCNRLHAVGALHENVFNHVVDKLVVDPSNLFLVAKRSSQHAGKRKQSAAAACEARRSIVVADEFALYAEHCVPKFEKSNVCGLKMWHEARAPWIPLMTADFVKISSRSKTRE